MSDQPELRLKATKDDIVAAMERDDYAWLVDNVFIPALAQFMRETHTAVLVKGSPFPRSRRQAGTHRHSHHPTRRTRDSGHRAG
jgi:hypothetical protein